MDENYAIIQTDQLWSFKDKWTLLDFNSFHETPSARSFSSLNELNGKLYLFGGFLNDRSLNDLWVFNIQKKRWKIINLDQIIKPRHHLSYINSTTNQLVILGGYNEKDCQKIVLDDIYFINLTNFEVTRSQAKLKIAESSLIVHENKAKKNYFILKIKMIIKIITVDHCWWI